MNCCVITGGGDYDQAAVARAATPRARVPHRCGECDAQIDVGERYERYTSLYDGRWQTDLTCLSCVEIRSHFSCDGWLFGEIWNELAQEFLPNLRAGGPCLTGLSPAGRTRLFELHLAHKAKVPHWRRAHKPDPGDKRWSDR